MKSGAGVNFPNSTLSAPALTAKDRRDLAEGLAAGVDFVGLSFVRSAGARRRSSGGSSRAWRPRRRPWIVSKIERTEALADLDRLAAASDALMVARGDLGVEIGLASVPRAQREILAAGRRHARARHRRDADAGVDDREPDADARRGLGRGGRRARRRGRRDALGRDGGRRVPGRGRRGDGRDRARRRGAGRGRRARRRVAAPRPETSRPSSRARPPEMAREAHARGDGRLHGVGADGAPRVQEPALHPGRRVHVARVGPAEAHAPPRRRVLPRPERPGASRR